MLLLRNHTTFLPSVPITIASPSIESCIRARIVLARTIIKLFDFITFVENSPRSLIFFFFHQWTIFVSCERYHRWIFIFWVWKYIIYFLYYLNKLNIFYTVSINWIGENNFSTKILTWNDIWKCKCKFWIVKLYSFNDSLVLIHWNDSVHLTFF